MDITQAVELQNDSFSAKTTLHNYSTCRIPFPSYGPEFDQYR